MLNKNKYDFCKKGVLGHITDNTGLKFTCSQLGKLFSVSTNDIRPILSELVNDGELILATVGRDKRYFIHTESEKKLIADLVAPKAFKPYQPIGAAWDAVRERISDYRAIPSLHIPR
jgi:hypothetical protein